MKRPTALFLLSVLITCCFASLAQIQARAGRVRWVAAWATAQQLMPASFPIGRGGAPPQGSRGPQIQAAPTQAAPSAPKDVSPHEQQQVFLLPLKIRQFE